MTDQKKSPTQSIWFPILLLSLPLAGLVFCFLNSFVQVQRRPNPANIQTRNCLKQVGIAFYLYNEERGIFPPGGTFDDEDVGQHGWQTFLLPYIDAKDLFQKVNFDVPWNAPENREAFCTEVQCYQSDRFPTPSKEGYERTHLAANHRLFFENSAIHLNDIPDGAGHTIFVGEVVGDYLPWGHPRNWRDPAIGINKGDHTFGRPDLPRCYFAMGDGAIYEFHEDIDPKVLEALSTPNGGEAVEGF